MNLTSDFLKNQKDALLAEKERIEEKIKGLKEYPDYGDDEEDGLQEIADYESNLSIDQQLESLLIKIKKALKSIEDGVYGKCSSCGQEIESGRMEIMPYADLCVTCSRKK